MAKSGSDASALLLDHLIEAYPLVWCGLWDRRVRHARANAHVHGGSAQLLCLCYLVIMHSLSIDGIKLGSTHLMLSHSKLRPHLFQASSHHLCAVISIQRPLLGYTHVAAT